MDFNLKLKTLRTVRTCEKGVSRYMHYEAN